MQSILRYGADATVRLEFSETARVFECGRPDARPIADIAGALAGALTDPLDYPPLARITTPGDRVVLALAPELPQKAEITSAVIGALAAAGVDPDGVTVLQTQAAAEQGDPCRLVAAEIRDRITTAVHDPADRDRLAYLATDRSGEPILLNRLLHDADLVLPIVCSHGDRVAGYHGLYSTLFPTYSDTRTQRHFRAPGSLESDGKLHRQLARQVAEVGWLLGVSFVTAVVAGPDGHVLHVLAGEARAVQRRADKLHNAAWAYAAPCQADLVVAAVEGGPAEQTWENVGHALGAAAALVADGGAIALCTELETPPGPALAQLADAPSRSSAMRHIRKARPEDTLLAAQLVRALESSRVYLLSRLDPPLVEPLDITPMADAAELVRLGRRYDSCILISNAPRVSASVVDA